MSKAKVVVYTTLTCVYCHALMSCLEEKGIDFEERDLSDEKIRQKATKALGYEPSSVPLTIIGDKEIQGFNRPAIKRALKHLESND
jgi:glutaredoxin